MGMKINRPLGWTTLEEAKQLVEAGLSVETADMFWASDADTVIPTPYITKTDNETLIPAYKGAIPCWSLGALLKLMPKSISVLVDERSAYFYGLEWQFANDNSLRYIATNRGKCLVDIYSDHDIGGKSFIETALEMIIWLLNNKFYEQKKC